MKNKLMLYYHEPSDALGIAGEGWNYLVAIKWVPFCRTPARKMPADCAKNPIDYVQHSIDEEMTDEWHLIGEL